MDAITGIIDSPITKLFVVMTQVFIFVFWFALVGWTYRDAKRRGTSSAYWVAVVLFFNVFGWLVYMMLRPPETLEETQERKLEIKIRQEELRKNLISCPACHKPVDKEFLICPHCRKKLKNPCPKCDKPLNLSWTICPFCRSTL